MITSCGSIVKASDGNGENSTNGDGFAKVFVDIEYKTSQTARRTSTFMTAGAVVLTWRIFNPIFSYSDTWRPSSTWVPRWLWAGTT
jgi:hypothetical protein